MARDLVIPGILIASVLGSGGAIADERRCYGDWSDAAPIVVREGLRSARDVQSMARTELGGDIVRIVLCKEEEGFVYRLMLRGVDGRIANLTVNAAPDTSD